MAVTGTKSEPFAPDDQPSSRAAGCDLSVVVPVYRSEDCVEALTGTIDEVLNGVLDYEIVLVNDGSPDGSWREIERACATNSRITGLDLRRNFGQDNAIMAGLRLARGRTIAIMDDDLQHDPHDLPAMHAALQEGGDDVVYANFHKKHQRVWKNLGSWMNGKMAEWLLDKPADIYLSPYKIMCGELVEAIIQYEGPDPYVDGLILQTTDRISQVTAQHQKRHSGQSNYTLVRSFWVWCRLVFSFSVKPIRMVTWFGISAAIVGLLGAAVVAVYRLSAPAEFTAEAVGWASLMTLILTLGGIQMFFLGILGEFVGRTHLKVSHKPQAIVARVLNHGDQAGGRSSE